MQGLVQTLIYAIVVIVCVVVLANVLEATL